MKIVTKLITDKRANQETHKERTCWALDFFRSIACDNLLLTGVVAENDS